MANLPSKKGSSKTAVIVIGLIVVVGVGLYFGNSSTFKGQLIGQETTVTDQTSLPDLVADITIDKPVQGQDLNATVTITNVGPGKLDGKTPFKYAIKVNGNEVFSNTNAGSEMAAGDSYSFSYPIPRALYKYPDTGTVSFVLDSDNVIKEANDDNNVKEISYSY